MFIRVWEYRVPREHVDAFTRAYGPEGPWARLFGRCSGYHGTSLFRDCSDEQRFLTVDSWSAESDWELFLEQWGAAYHALDEELTYLTVEDHDLLG